MRDHDITPYAGGLHFGLFATRYACFWCIISLADAPSDYRRHRPRAPAGLPAAGHTSQGSAHRRTPVPPCRGRTTCLHPILRQLHATQDWGSVPLPDGCMPPLPQRLQCPLAAVHAALILQPLWQCPCTPADCTALSETHLHALMLLVGPLSDLSHLSSWLLSRLPYRGVVLDPMLRVKHKGPSKARRKLNCTGRKAL